jgi:hypothetical protein
MMNDTTILALTPPEGSRLPVEAIVAWILDAFPGWHVVHENSFEAERERYRSHYKRWLEQCTITNDLSLGIDLMIKSSLGKDQRCGPGKDILISTIGSKNIRGRVWSSSVLLFTELSIENEAVQRLESFLRSLQLGEPSIYIDDGKE